MSLLRCRVLCECAAPPYASARVNNSSTLLALNFCRPLKSTGAGAKLNISRGSALRFSSNESNEIGGDGLVSNGNIGFDGEGETLFSGCVVDGLNPVCFLAAAPCLVVPFSPQSPPP